MLTGIGRIHDEKGCDMAHTKLAALGVATTVVLMLTACSAGMGGGTGADDSKATGAFDWKRYSGTTIDVMLDEHPWTNGVKDELSAFTEQTGIQVNVKTYAEDLYFDKMNQALRTSTAPDVVMTGFDYSVATQQAAGLLEPLTTYLNNASLTDSAYDLDDFPAGVLAPAELPSGSPDSALYGIPISTETYILFYNKKLVDEYLGGKVPATMDELTAAAEKITQEGGGDIYGSVVRGVRSAAIVDTPTAVVLNEWSRSSAGIELPYNVWFDGGWGNPRMTDAAIVKGLDNYAKLIAAGPPNRFNLDWPDANALFSQGKAAFYLDASVFGPTFEDPTQSKIAGSVGYSPLPTGASGGTTGLWSWGLSMAKSSAHKGAAWTFMQWITDKQHTAALGALTGGPPRQSSGSISTYTDKLNPAYVAAVTSALSTAQPTAIMKADAEPLLLEIVDTVLAMANGVDPEKAAQDAQDKLAALGK